jgi:hypothetical protein
LEPKSKAAASYCGECPRDNNTISYTHLFEGTTSPESFTPEQQAAIDNKCGLLKNSYSSLPIKDRNFGF